MRRSAGFILMMMVIAIAGFTQEPWNKEASVREARSSLALLSSPEGEIFAFCVKNQIKGEFEMDITMQGKGEIISVFMVASNVDDIRARNLLKDKIIKIRMKEIRIPKNERIKFRQTLTFNY